MFINYIYTAFQKSYNYLRNIPSNSKCSIRRKSSYSNNVISISNIKKFKIVVYMMEEVILTVHQVHVLKTNTVSKY